MTREDAYEKLNGIFRDVFDDDSITLHDASTADDVEGWDSLEHINLMAAIENAFHIKFDMGEINSFKNVGELVNMILRKVGL